MTKTKKLVAVALIAVFSAVSMYGCSGVSTGKLSTAKDYTLKVVYYLDLARTLVDFAVKHYADNAKVMKAVNATNKAVAAAQAALQMVASGLDKDTTELSSCTAKLITAVVELTAAIKDAMRK